MGGGVDPLRDTLRVSRVRHQQHHSGLSGVAELWTDMNGYEPLWKADRSKLVLTTPRSAPYRRTGGR